MNLYVVLMIKPTATNVWPIVLVSRSNQRVSVESFEPVEECLPSEHSSSSSNKFFFFAVALRALQIVCNH